MSKKLKINLTTPDWPMESIHKSIETILDSNTLSAMSTSMNGSSYVHTAYFVYSENLDLYFISQPTDQHIKNIENNPSIAVAIWIDSGIWGENLQGIQIFGECKQVKPGIELVKAMKLFMGRFKAFSGIIKNPGEFSENVSSRMYVIRPKSIKLLDEPSYGRRNYLQIDVA